jgi:hypothetical protein
MIQKTDLRIGNHLQYFIGEEGCDWSDTKIDWQDLKWCDELNENFNKVHKGIPITETFFTTNNFVYDGNNTGIWWKNLQTHYLEMISGVDGWYPVFIQMPELSSESEQRVGLRRIEYIHELENLFFVLTGEELNPQL